MWPYLTRICPAVKQSDCSQPSHVARTDLHTEQLGPESDGALSPVESVSAVSRAAIGRERFGASLGRYRRNGTAGSRDGSPRAAVERTSAARRVRRSSGGTGRGTSRVAATARPMAAGLGGRTRRSVNLLEDWAKAAGQPWKLQPRNTLITAIMPMMRTWRASATRVGSRYNATAGFRRTANPSHAVDWARLTCSGSAVAK
jgi:hypothetical protein